MLSSPFPLLTVAESNAMTGTEPAHTPLPSVHAPTGTNMIDQQRIAPESSAVSSSALNVHVPLRSPSARNVESGCSGEKLRAESWVRCKNSNPVVPASRTGIDRTDFVACDIVLVYVPEIAIIHWIY
jgi:hypothetical protein